MKVNGLLNLVLPVCLLVACSSDPRQEFSDEIARAKAAHQSILIYATSFGYYWGSSVARKRTVDFINTTDEAITQIRFHLSRCKTEERMIEDEEFFSLVGPFPAGGYFSVESSPPAKVYDRFVIKEIEVDFVDGRHELHQADIASLLTGNVSNFCPTKLR